MKKELIKLVKQGTNFVVRHAPEIATGISIVCGIASVIFTADGTIKAMNAIAEKEEAGEIDSSNPSDVVKIAWKYYIPAAVSGAASVALAIAGLRESTKRTAAITAAYTLTRDSYDEYKSKVKEMLGERKEKKVEEAIAQDIVDRDPVDISQVSVVPGKTYLCKDYISGRYFYSCVEDIKNAIININYRLENEMFVSYNDFYYELDNKDLKPNGIGESIGWNIDKGLLSLEPFHLACADNGEPCLVLMFDIEPRYDYINLH